MKLARRGFLGLLALLFGVRKEVTPSLLKQQRLIDKSVRHGWTAKGMISWDFEPGDPPPKIITSRRALIFDATGREWPMVVWCDTETGQLKRHIADRAGQVQFDPINDCILAEIIYAPAPLRVVWKDTCASSPTA